MSILMDALKQQHQTSAPPSDSSAFWRKLALLLALLLAASSGALLAYWLTPSQSATKAADSTVVAVTEPATAVTIAAALTQVEPAPQDKNKTTTAPAGIAVQAPVQLQQQLTNAIAPPPEPVSEPFVSPPPVATVTAGTAAAEPVPLSEQPVSAELRDKFASAMQATEQRGSAPPARSQTAPATDIGQLDSAILQQIPPLKFEAHVYATAVNQRWVKVNGKTLQEGQWVTADIRIKEITPQFVLLQWGDMLFSMAALSEWAAR